MEQATTASNRRRLPPSIRYLPGQLTMGVAVAGMAGAWLLVIGGYVGTFALLSPRGSASVVPLAVMAVAAGPAVWVTRRVLVLRRVCTQVPMPLLRQRRYGDLTAVAEDDGRPLRPVGMAVIDVVARTDALLGSLTSYPGVRIFQGVRLPGAVRPVASHAVSAGRSLVLVESVAWPAGRYRTDLGGRVNCDGQYIGQTTRALTAAVGACRAILPRSHRVCALIVVHRAVEGDYVLPADTRDLRWTIEENLTRDLHRLLSPHLFSVSRHVVAALACDTARHREGMR